MRFDKLTHFRIDRPNILLFLIFLTSSFDKLLNLKIAGFSIRFTYLMMMTYIALSFLRNPIIFTRKFALLGGKVYIFWTVALFFSMWNTVFLLRNVGFYFWHILHTLFIVTLAVNIKTKSELRTVLKIYIISIWIMALFGLVQFVFGLMGISICTELWWTPRLPRLNGFSYEPSYYGTYLLLGWVTSLFMLLERNDLFGNKISTVIFWTITLTMVISTARAPMFVVVALIIGLVIYTLVRSLVVFKIKRKYLFLTLVVCTIFCGAGVLAVKNFEKIRFALEGTGIGGTTAGSKSKRLMETMETVEIIKNSPVLGVGLGGVATARSVNHGIIPKSNSEAVNFEGMNVILETIASSGMIGSVFFILYLLQLHLKPLFLSKKIGDSNSSMILKGLAFAVGCEFLALTMNQNLLRAYLWIHIAVLTAAYSVIKSQYKGFKEIP